MNRLTLLKSSKKKQFPQISGFQNCHLSQIDGFQPTTDEAIKIRFTAENHWVTTTSLDKQLALYDSNHRTELHPSLTHQLSAIYKHLIDTKDEDGDDIPHVQQQYGSDDCRLFEITPHVQQQY